MHRRFQALLILLVAGAAAAAERLPAYLLQVPDTVADIFVADASAATLYHYARTDEGLLLAGTSYMSIGENGAGKEREWDRRTPLGIYFVVDRLDTSRLHEKYGLQAFPLDYPNIRDRQKGRSGNGIWVHGVPPGTSRRPERDTDGCIALPNDALDALAPAFVPATTPVIVARKLRFEDAADRARITEELRAAVTAWAHALAAAEPQAYFDLYAPGFRYRGMDRAEWRSFRAASLGKRGAVPVKLGELLLLEDPEEPGIYLARFRQRTGAPDAAFDTVKRLYWQRQADGQLRIIAEDNG